MIRAELGIWGDFLKSDDTRGRKAWSRRAFEEAESRELQGSNPWDHKYLGKDSDLPERRQGVCGGREVEEAPFLVFLPLLISSVLWTRLNLPGPQLCYLYNGDAYTSPKGCPLSVLTSPNSISFLYTRVRISVSEFSQ